ncbi:MAG: SDR family oxidoreductase [Gemmatimonadetes bacterium]|nr:SDR family oxidoreductase [Gemmatimonadota bacterium]
MQILVTGATGYVGGRLVPRLLRRGHDVRVFVRDPARVSNRPWGDQVEVFRGDMSDPASVRAALEGMDAAFYLVHAMGHSEDFAATDRQWAHTFVAAATECPTLRKTVYLGGLLPEVDQARSRHLSSRAEVGEILRAGTPTLEFRAGPVIGSGSASFEMVRYLTERLPAMIAPRWIRNRVQPVGVRSVLVYLCEGVEREGATGIVEIGADRLSFRDMMLQYAEVRGLKRLIVPVPILAPSLAGRWVGLVTPITKAVAIPLVEGIVHPVLADTTRAQELFPDNEPMTYREAVRLALQRVDEGQVMTRWSGALGSAPAYRFEDREGMAQEIRTRWVKAAPEQVYRSFASLGGRRGWRVWGPLWRLRGFVDQLVGGPGLRRGRRHPVDLEQGEAVDFWRVEEARAPELLRLRAEMKVPGRAWLQWEAIPEDRGTRLIQTASFVPFGVPGALYWYGAYPAHRFIFDDLVDAVVDDAEAGIPGLHEVA